MRKFNIYSLIISLFFLITFDYNVEAFSKNFPYNYEVTNFKIDNKNNVTISGWAIINAGVNDGSSGVDASPGVDDSRGSTYSNPYTYTLYVEPIKYTEGTSYYVSDGSRVLVKTMSATDPNLTWMLCYKPNENKCVAKDNAPYDQTGFSFTFNLEKDIGEFEDANGYIFWLNIKSTQNSCWHSWCNQTFKLAIPADAIDPDSKKMIETSTQLSDVNVIGNGVWLDTSNADYLKVSANHFQVCSVWWRKYSCSSNIPYTYATLNSINKGTPNSYNLNFYNPSSVSFKYDGRKYSYGAGWYNALELSAVYVAPKQGSFTIIKEPEPSFIPTPFEDCTISDMNQPSETKSANACNTNVTFENTTSASCITATSTQYYDVTCVEEVDVDFDAPVYNGKLKPGLGFSYSLKATSELICTGTFDYTLWKENYDKQKVNRDNYETNSAKWIEFNNNIKKLESLYQNFLNYRGTSYNFNPAATLTLKYKESGNNKTSTVDMIVSKTETDSSGIEVKDETIDYSKAPDPFTHKYTNSKTFILPLIYYNVKTRLYESASSNENVLLGNKMYLSKGIDVGNHSLSITVSNLGYSGNWKATNDNCGIEVSEEEYIYRTYDEKDPFVSANLERVIGENWKNSRFDFTKLASKNTSSSTRNLQYSFELNKDDINNIKKDSKYDTSVYLGSNCTYNKETTNYSCSIINNYNTAN